MPRIPIVHSISYIFTDTNTDYWILTDADYTFYIKFVNLLTMPDSRLDEMPGDAKTATNHNTILSQTDSNTELYKI